MDAQETGGKDDQTAIHSQTSIGSEGNVAAVLIGVENTTGGDVTAEQSSDERWTKSLEDGAEMLKPVGSFGAPEVEDSPGWRKTHSRSHSAFAGKVSTEILGVRQISYRDANTVLASASLSAQTRQASASEANLQSLSSVSPDHSNNTSHHASFAVSISSHTSLCESGGPVDIPKQTDPGYVISADSAVNPQDCCDSGPQDSSATLIDSKPGSGTKDMYGATEVGVKKTGISETANVTGPMDGSGAPATYNPGVVKTVFELSPTLTKDEVMEHIVQLKLQIVALQEENEKLKEVRANMDNDLHELTANLFQEAYKMVDEAKGEKMSAEKRLADASGRIEALQTEVLALKSLLQSPVKIETPTHKAKQKSPLRKSLNFSKKAKDDKNARLPQSSSDMMLPVHATPFTVIEHKSTPRGACIQHGEPLPVEFEEFRQWVENISLSRDNPYMARILHTDIKPCLNFADKELSEKVFDAIEQNSLLIESIPSSSQVVSECALTGPCSKDKHCTHQITVGDSTQSHFISKPCRDRIVAVCEFYVYTRHIEKKIVRLDALTLYWQISRLRALMSLARLSLQLPEME